MSEEKKINFEIQNVLTWAYDLAGLARDKSASGFVAACVKLVDALNNCGEEGSRIVEEFKKELAIVKGLVTRDKSCAPRMFELAEKLRKRICEIFDPNYKSIVVNDSLELTAEETERMFRDLNK